MHIKIKYSNDIITEGCCLDGIVQRFYSLMIIMKRWNLYPPRDIRNIIFKSMIPPNEPDPPKPFIDDDL